MKHVSKTGILVSALAVVAAAIATGCASAPPRTEASTEASASGIRAAEEVGAAEVPRAAFHLQLAKEELEHAKELIKKNEKERAASLLMRAEADGELAIALSHADAEKSEARAAMERVRQLRQDNQLPAEQHSHSNERNLP